MSLEVSEFLYQHKPIEAAFLKIAKVKEVQAPLYECQRSKPQKQH